MRTSFAGVTAVCLGICTSAAAVHASSDLEPVALHQILAEYGHQVLLGPTRDVGSSRDLLTNTDIFLPLESRGPNVLPTGRKMLQGQVTTDVTDPSPPNSTVSTYEIEDECPQIKNGTHLCETGPWIIEGGARITYNLTVPVSEKALALQVTLEPVLGNPDMFLFLVDTFGAQAIGDNSLRYAGREVVTVDSSFLPPGVMIAIVVHAQHTRASFDLTVDLFEEGRQVSQRDAKALAAISAACCQNGTCNSDDFTQYATDQTALNPCAVPGWYCNAAGHLTHLILDNQGFQCKAIDLSPLAQMKDLYSFSLNNAPGLTGDINTFLAHFKDDHALRVLDLQSNGMTGKLPAACEDGHQFTKLVQLQLDTMRISGHIPDCLMRVEDLFIARTNLHETLPEIPADSPMRRLTLIQEDNNKPRIKGDAAVFEQLANLQLLSLAYTSFTGTLKVGPQLRWLQTVGLPFTKFVAASQSRLEGVAMVDGKLAGTVPPELLNDSDMAQLNLRNNSLTGIDQDFMSLKLLVLDLSYNAIEGPLPPALGRQPWLAFVTVAHNKLTGPIAEFTRSIEGNNIVHYFDISGNQLTGPLSGLESLGAIARVDTLLVHPQSGMKLPNVVNASSNNFEGSLPLAYYAAASAGGPDRLPLVIIDIRGNELMECIDPEIQSPMVQVVCDPVTPAASPSTSAAARPPVRDVSLTDEADAVATPAPPQAGEPPGGAGASTLGGDAIAGIIVAVIAVAVLAMLLAAFALRRYKQEKQDAWTAATLDERMTSGAGTTGLTDPTLK